MSILEKEGKKGCVDSLVFSRQGLLHPIDQYYEEQHMGVHAPWIIGDMAQLAVGAIY